MGGLYGRGRSYAVNAVNNPREPSVCASLRVILWMWLDAVTCKLRQNLESEIRWSRRNNPAASACGRNCDYVALAQVLREVC